VDNTNDPALIVICSVMKAKTESIKVVSAFIRRVGRTKIGSQFELDHHSLSDESQN
jgi:hypothetical protein